MTRATRRWFLIYVGTFLLAMTAYIIAGWWGWAIFAVSTLYGTLVGATE